MESTSVNDEGFERGGRGSAVRFAHASTVCPILHRSKLGDRCTTLTISLIQNIGQARITLKKQVYRCKACHESCTHDLPFLLTPKAQITTRPARFIVSLMDLGITYSDIARITGPNDRTIRDIRNRRDAERALNPVPRYTVILGLDDWQHGDLRKRRAMLVDRGNKMPIDLFETCRADDSIMASPVPAGNESGLRQQPSRVIVGLATELKQYLAIHHEGVSCSKTGESSSAPVEGAVHIQQDAAMAVAELTPHSSVTHALAPGRAVWLHVVFGEVSLNGEVLHDGDSAAVQAEDSLEIVGLGTQNAEVLLFDLA
jgi:hypothetical protein